MSCQSLKVKNRTLRTLPGRLLLGPTGARLGVDYLDPLPGFAGRIDFIHKMNIPLLFRVEALGDGPVPPVVDSTWYPDRLEMSLTSPPYTLRDTKWIPAEDLALPRQAWRTHSADPLMLHIVLPEGAVMGTAWQVPCCIHGLSPLFLTGSTASWQGGLLGIPAAGRA